MKKVILHALFVSALMVPLISSAQYDIPNGSFETWTNSTTAADWITASGTVIQTPVVNYTLITQNGDKTDTQKLSRPAKDGSNSIMMYSMNNGAVPCVIAQKFAMKGRPQNFSMNYAYFPGTSNDQFAISIVFTKWNDAKVSKHDTILGGGIKSAAAFAEPWQTLLNVSIASLYSTTLPDTEEPDTAIIVIYNAIQASSAPSALYIDKIWFTDTPVTADIDQNGMQQNDPSGIYAYPNPFTNQTAIHYSLANSGQVNLTVYDMQGKAIRTLVDGDQAQGTHDKAFDANGLGNGLYIYKLQTSTGVQTGKLILDR